RPSVDETLVELGVGVDPAIAQKRPIAPRLGDQVAIAIDYQNLFAVGAGARQHVAEGVTDERAAPELEAALDADAVDGDDEDAVGDGVRALHRLPRCLLRRAEALFLRVVPANRRRVEEHVGTAQCRQTGGLGKPLVPTNQRSDVATRGRKTDKTIVP